MARNKRNMFLFGGAAAVVALATVIGSVNSVERTSAGGPIGTGGGSLMARRYDGGVPVDPAKDQASRDAVVASVASKGKTEIIVEVAAKLSPNASAQSRANTIAAAQDNVIASVKGSANVVARTTSLPVMLVSVDEEAARGLANSTAVVSMMENRYAAPTLDETIPLIGGPNVYNQGVTGKGWSVAILDTAQDTSHPFFSERVLEELCFSSNSDYANSICPNGDDTDEGPGAAANCQVDWCRHGTHVAGIAAGNGYGGSGVAPDAGIISINVFMELKECAGEEHCIRSSVYDRIAAMNWVLEHHDEYKIAAVNMSIGGGQYFDQASCDADNGPEKAAIDALVAANVAVLIASGNEEFSDSLGAPGCISSAIAVGSTTKQDEISDFSNSSDMLDILAPGSDIVSAAPGGGWATLSGTSMATPHVAGAFTLLRSAKPSATVQEIYTALANGGKQIRDPRNGITRSRIQLDSALQKLRAGGGSQPNPNPAPRPSPTRPAPQRGPVNDDQDNPTEINSANFRDTVDVRTATASDDSPIQPTYYCPEGGIFEKSVWYSFTAPSDGYLTITTQGSNYDTIMSVWKGSRGAPYQTGCSDDDRYPNVLTSTISGWVQAGTTFRIQVAAWDDGGTLVFSSRFQAYNASSVVPGSAEGATFDAAE
ncbi:MAG: S8 family serine peptidase [bacterium]